MTEKKKELSPKKRAFVDAYMSDIRRNQTAAAIAAGYSEKSARVRGSELMKDAAVAAAIKEIEDERHRENTAQENEVIEFLTSVMRGEDVETCPLFVGDGEQQFKDGKPSARDRLKAAEMLAKHYGLFDDKRARTNDKEIGIVVMPEILDEDNTKKSF